MEAPAAPPSMTFSTGVSMAQMGQYVSKPELCMTHTETLPVVNTAATSQAFSATMATRVANTLEQPAGATQWKTTSNMNNGQMMQGHG